MTAHLPCARVAVRLVWVAGLTLLVTACGGSTSVSGVSSPSAIRCQASMTGVPASVSANETRITATVVTSRECQWDLITEAAWVRVDPSSGQGESTLGVVVLENTVGISRTTNVTLNGTRTAIRQDAAECRYRLTGPGDEIQPDGGPVEFRVAATDGCQWTAASNAGWLAGTRTSGQGNGTASFMASANTGAARTAVVTVLRDSVSVTQRAAVPTSVPSPSPAPDPPPVPPPTPAPSPTPAPAPAPPPTPGPTPPPTPGPGPTPTPPPAPPAPTPPPQPPPPQPPPPERVELTGAVTSLTGSCPALTFVLQGRRVSTDGATQFTQGNCRHMENGREIGVAGVVQAGGVVYASRVELKNNLIALVE